MYLYPVNPSCTSNYPFLMEQCRLYQSSTATENAEGSIAFETTYLPIVPRPTMFYIHTVPYHLLCHFFFTDDIIEAYDLSSVLFSFHSFSS